MTRIICLVPSITETLIKCKLNVVGRTRFCIHPEPSIKLIPSVAGTKDINWEKVARTKPDLVIFDKEENTLEMAETCPYPYIALHITSVDNVGSELTKLAEQLDDETLLATAERWNKVAQLPNKDWRPGDEIPGSMAALHSASQETDSVVSGQKALQKTSVKYVDYMIWKKPWMTIGPNTFIWSMLEKLGFGDFLIFREDKYPNIGDTINPNEDTFYLFSSEPFPFKNYISDLEKEGFKGAIIDGESYSWYGIRSLEFLEKQLSTA
jgi:hypothetical protein